MSVVTLQLGQCGTQIGQALFDCLAAETVSDQGSARSPLDVFFRPVDERPSRTTRNRRHARAVLVDMEPKVVNMAIASAAHSATNWCYPPNSSFLQQSGSGNNWARGYNSYGPKFASTVCELVRREAEQADYLGGFLLLQSMAGGTGAGLGTYIAEAIRDTFPSSFLMNHCIWPYQSGEVIVQNYNSLLTLAHLAEISDGIILMENSALHTACQRLLNIQRPSFNDLNGVAARSIASSLLPACYRPAAGGTSQQGKQITLFGDVVEKVCCHPAYRLLSLRALPQMPPASVDFTTFTWPAILRRLRQMQITGADLPAIHAHLLGFLADCCTVAAAVAAVLLLCCCCCCAVAAAVLLLCCCCCCTVAAAVLLLLFYAVVAATRRATLNGCLLPSEINTWSR
ncbi:TPA: hypothetical protein ACH3X1_011092 [Trebouxia sp. C0004]